MMKKLLFIAAISVASSTVAYAADNGFYAGFQAGYGDSGFTKNNLLPTGNDVMSATNSELINDNNMDNAVDIWSSTLASTTTTSSSSGASGGFGGRVFAGYQFSPYFALETGYLYLTQNLSGSATYQGAGEVTQPGPFGLDSTVSPATASVTVKNELTSEQVIDLAAKVMLPIENTGFSPYAKVGVAFVNAKLTNTVQNVSVNIQGVDSSQVNAKAGNIEDGLNQTGNYTEFCPEGALGVDYDITSNLSVDASWIFIKGVGNIQNINYAGVGLIYHFA